MVAKQPSSGFRKRGFTMIELLVVVGILGIIAAVGIPSIGRALKKEGMRKAVSDFVEACSDARATAILKQQTQTLTVRPHEHTFRSPSKSFEFPDNVQIEFLGANFSLTAMEEEETRVHFYPNGTSDEFSILLRGEDQKTVKIELELVTGLANVEYSR